MKVYSFGTETVPVALAGDLLVGSAHDGRNYRIMLARLEGGVIVETRFLAGENDWEGHSALSLNDGYFIGGAVEGTATPSGGEDWRAYLARLDENLSRLWELKLDVRNNGAVYSILPAGEEVLIAGETGGPGDKGFFLGKVSLDGKLLWLKDFGSWEDAVFTSLLPSENGLELLGSVKAGTGLWVVNSFRFSRDGKFLREDTLFEGIALTARIWKGKLVLGGYRGGNFWVRAGDSEAVLGDGSVTSILPLGKGLLAGGELGGKAVIVEIANGEGPKIRELWENGWIEVLNNGLVLGVMGTAMVVLSLGNWFPAP